jgi:hypothetical protein
MQQAFVCFLQVDNGLPAATDLIFKLSGMTAIYQMSKVIYLPWFTIDSPVYASLDHPLFGFAGKRV